MEETILHFCCLYSYVVNLLSYIINEFRVLLFIFSLCDYHNFSDVILRSSFTCPAVHWPCYLVSQFCGHKQELGQQCHLGREIHARHLPHHPLQNTVAIIAVRVMCFNAAIFPMRNAVTVVGVVLALADCHHAETGFSSNLSKSDI